MSWGITSLFMAGLALMVCLIAVMFRTMMIWTRIVEAVDQLPDAHKLQVGWPTEKGKAIHDRNLRNRTMWYGGPPGIPEAARKDVKAYRATLLGSYCVMMIAMMGIFAWQIVFLALPAGLAALIVRPWPKLQEVDA